MISLSCTEILGYHDPRTYRYSHEENQQEVDYRSRTSDSRKGIVSYVLAYNDTVDCVIQLLEHIADQHRYHKFYDLTDGVADRHIYRFKYFLPHPQSLPFLKKKRSGPRPGLFSYFTYFTLQTKHLCFPVFSGGSSSSHSMVILNSSP